jgi:regulator of CtrA degradation
MRNPADISPTIVEALYREALELAEEARDGFDMSGKRDEVVGDDPTARIALSCEALRTTTRMMHAIAWLLNHKAYINGELSEFQLRRHGRLPPPQPETDPVQLEMLPHDLRDLVARSKLFYQRIERLDASWRKQFEMQPAAILRLHERLNEALATN